MKKTQTKRFPLPVILAIFFAACFLVLPLIFVIVQALSQGIGAYLANITEEYTQKAMLLTLKTTVVVVLVNTVFGLFAAWTVTKYNFPGRKALTTFIDLPLSVSPVISGLAFLLVFGRTSPLYGLLEGIGLKVVYAVPGIVLATLFVTFPYISREMIPVLSAQGRDEEEAAALMGAGWFTIFWRVTFPHIKWSLLYGVVLCTARAMGEFGAVSILSGHLRGKTNTLPLHIEILYNEFRYSEAFAVSSILVILALLVLVLRSLIEHRGRKGEA